jgi:hypothetical protein
LNHGAIRSTLPAPPTSRTGVAGQCGPAASVTHLRPSDTVTSCPYKGTTTAYWSVQGADELRADLAWSYDFPTRQLLPIAGLVAFYDEQVDVFLDGVAQPRPTTHFFS